MNNKSSRKTLKLILTLILTVSIILSAFMLSSHANTDPSENGAGRKFTGENAASNIDERLELTRPLTEIPLTWEAVIKIDGTTDELCKGTLFGNFGNRTGTTTTFANFEIFRHSKKAPDPAPALCFASDENGTSYGAVAFSRDSTPIEDADGKTNTLSDHIGEWVHVAVVATPIGDAGNSYEFNCYINGSKAYATVKRENCVFWTEENLIALQNNNAFGLGSNSAVNPVEFPGNIRHVALYEKSFTADEVELSYKKGVGAVDGNLIAHYDMTVVEDRFYEKDLSGNGYDLAIANKTYFVNSEGRSFADEKERLTLTKKITEAPLTIEAHVKSTTTGTTIFGNTVDASTGCLNFEIYKGDPALCFPKDASGTRGSVIFTTPLDGVTPFVPNSDVTGDFTQIVITATPTGVENKYNFDCYVNGVKAYETIENKMAYLDAELIQAAGNLSIGSNGKGISFNGNIRRVNLYNRPLSIAEIRASYLFSTTFDGLIAGYDMSDSSHVRNPQFEEDISGNGYHAQKASTVGLTFETPTNAPEDHLYVYNNFDDMPRTIEATVYTTKARGCVIIGNHPGTNDGNNIDFEIFKEGVPAIVIVQNGVVQSMRFKNYKVATNEWVHLAAVIEKNADGNAVFVLYANGVEVDRIDNGTEYVTLDMEKAQNETRKFAIGTDLNTTDSNRYFHGSILDVAMYSEALSAEEIMDSYKNGININNDALMAYYDLKSVVGKDFVQDISGNNHHAARFDYSEVEGGRWFNLYEETLSVVKNYEQAPLTISAEIYIPETVNKATTIFGNLYERDYINFEITSNNRAALVINELTKDLISTSSTAVTHSIIFNANIPQGRYTKLTVVYDKYNTTDERYVLYVDGVKSEDGYTFGSIHNDIDADGNKIVSHTFELDMDWIQRAIPFTLGRDAKKTFRGKIKNLTLYNAPLSANAVAEAVENGVNTDDDRVIAHYNLDNPENTELFVKDETGNGYDFAYKFFETEYTDEDYDYSFAFIGDTQKLIYKDVTEGTTEYTKPIYDWLIANKDDTKLKYVFGLGDVSDKNMLAEYKYASYLFNTLGEAGIDYAVIPGNHDGQTTYVNYNSIFSKDSYLTDGINCYSDASVANYYKNFEVGEYKYMVMVLEFGAPDAVLEWANGVVASNPDRQVIVLTHGYIGYDSGFLSEKELHAPVSTRGLNSGEELWEKFISLHENIVISACGHIDPYNIKQRHDVGVNGNTVHQFLIDGQALDKNWNYDTGMVAMFYFSNGGKTVRVEYVSATQSMREAEKDSNAKNVVFGKENQFSFSLDIPKAENISTEYGDIPRINTNLDLNAAVLFDSNKNFLGGYSSMDKALSAMLTYDRSASYVILLRDDVRMSSNVSMESFVGNLTVDLAGHEIVLDASGSYLINVCVNNASAPNSAYIFKNGAITKVGGYSINCLNYTGEDFSADSTTSFVYDNVTFRSTSSKLTANTVFTSLESGYDTASAKMNVSAEFINCTFDMRNSTDNAIMLALGADGKDRTVYSVTLRGGKILVSDPSDIARFYTADGDENGRADRLVFAKEDGKYVSLEALSSASLPTVYNTEEGYECVFVETSKNGENVNYSLYPEVMLGYKVKSSITLHSGLIYNIYIPVQNALSFTVNGNTAVYETVKLDEKEYYKVSVKLSSGEALNDINLNVILKSGESEVGANWTLNLVKYAERVLNNDNGLETKLVSDILSYVRAAYDYFGISDAENIAKINALLGEDYDKNNAPKMNGSEKVPSVGFKSVTFVLNSIPAMRFHLADGANPENYAFVADGKKLNAEVGCDSKGTYVEISVYAYLMGKNIEYVIDGVDSGSYHIKSYYEFAKTLNDDKLVTLVERFVKYCESAEEYRLSVIGQ